ncbi:MAG: bacillithiol transferase BstA [Pyrinomonadaceae bacterium]
MIEDLRYPIGKFEREVVLPSESRGACIVDIGELPARIAAAVNGLDDARLDTPYRLGGWTVRQTVHHIADSHMNAYCRFKLALTEDMPTIRPYYEDRWAELSDSSLPVGPSLAIIEGIHKRWTAFLSNMSDADFERKLDHPESGEWTLDEMLRMYAWHSRHHTAHITSLRHRNGW